MPLFPPTRPRYKNAPRVILSLLQYFATGQRASIITAADDLFAGACLSVHVDGTEFIPRETPFITIFNHYENPRLAAWWGPLLISRTIAHCRAREPRHVRWVMTREWWYPPGSFGRVFKQPITRWFFDQVAQTYGLILVPPILAENLTRGQGVLGVRRALALTRGENPQLVGLSPEGHTGPGGALKEPPPGAGLFTLHLTHGQVPLLPVVWYENELGMIMIRFGAPFHLNVPHEVARESRDRAAMTQSMTVLAQLLPQRLRGAYGDVGTREIAQ